jgi:GNAT superfamily N-acetyltransferase
MPGPQVTVHPSTEDRFADLRRVLAPKNGSPQACWCLTYRLTNAENSRLAGEDRPRRLQEFCRGRPAPGLLAYVDGAPAGWCALGPRQDFARLERSRTIQRLDQVPVWSVVCLMVRAGYRGIGVAQALIAGAVDYAARHGAPALEAYPIETHGARVSSVLAFTGTTRLFAAAGFQLCAVTTGRSAGRQRVIMRRSLAARNDAA